MKTQALSVDFSWTGGSVYCRWSEAIVLRGCSPRIRLSADLLITWRVTCTAPCWKLRNVSVPKMQWHLKFAGLGDSILISRTIPGDRKHTRTQSILKFLSSSVLQLLAFHWRWVNGKKIAWTKNAIYANVYNATSLNCSHRFINGYVWFKTPYQKMFNYATHKSLEWLVSCESCLVFDACCDVENSLV